MLILFALKQFSRVGLPEVCTVIACHSIEVLRFGVANDTAYFVLTQTVLSTIYCAAWLGLLRRRVSVMSSVDAISAYGMSSLMLE
jgi:hypothetical protein